VSQVNDAYRHGGMILNISKTYPADETITDCTEPVTEALTQLGFQVEIFHVGERPAWDWEVKDT
jgi:hypothetical protein